MFTMRDPQVMLTQFKSLVMSRFHYASRLWSPYLLKHGYLINMVQRTFTTGMCYISYSQCLELQKKLDQKFSENKRTNGSSK